MLEELRTSEAVAASLWPLEVTNGLLTAERRGRLEAPGARQFLHLLLSLPVVVDPVATLDERLRKTVAAEGLSVLQG